MPLGKGVPTRESVAALSERSSGAGAFSDSFDRLVAVMPYTVQLNESTYHGRTLSCDVAGERFDNPADASAAAKSEAFHLSMQLGLPVAIRIFEDSRIYLSHIMPAPPR